METPKTVLITGITGSGGSYLAEYILKNHPTVKVAGFSRKNYNLLDFNLLVKGLQRVDPSLIFHLASMADVRESFVSPQDYLSNNILGTCNLFEAVRAAKINPTIMHCSTSEVYGNVTPDECPITELCEIEPANPYAISKTAQDYLGQMYYRSYGLKIIITRMFAYINPRRTNLFASSFAYQIARIESGLQRELCHGNLDSVRTLIDVRDAMEAYWIAGTVCRPGQIYNIGGEEPITVGEFLERLCSKAKVPIFQKMDKALLRPTDVTLQVPDCTKFEKETGWKPKISLDDSMDWLLEQCRRKIHEESSASNRVGG